MKQQRIFRIALLTLVTAVLTAAGQEGPSAGARDERKSWIVGVVLDVNDARIPNARVRIEDARSSHEMFTSDEGAFEFELPAGMYRITVEAEGFRTVEVVAFRARADTRESLKVRMKVKPPQSTLKIE